MRDFEALIQPHRELLLNLARKLCCKGEAEPEDLVQDTLERALRHLEQLREASPGARRAWLCTTLQHRFLDHCRRHRTESRESPVLELVRAPVVVREPREWRPWELLSEEDVRGAISRLRPSLRTAVELHTAGLRYKAIAERLGISRGTVSFWMHQARHELEVSLRPLAAARQQELAA